MTIKEVAEFLQVSERAVNRYVAKGRLPVRYDKRPGGHHIGFYDPADVKKLKKQFTTLKAAPAPKPPPREPGRALVQRAHARLDGVSELTDALVALATKATGVPLENRLTLNLDDAAHLSGLSRWYLLSAIRDGRLRAAVRGKSWNITRRDLEKFVLKL
jgi:hypothetical protein